jgi:hypothetical protein
MNELVLREYVFRAVVTFDALASASATSGYLDGTRSLCIIQPTGQFYLPALISLGESPRQTLTVSAVLRIRLTDTEAAELFSPGQRFALWSDAFVGRTVRGEGLVGFGVICAQDSHSPATAAAVVPA